METGQSKERKTATTALLSLSVLLLPLCALPSLLILLVLQPLPLLALRAVLTVLLLRALPHAFVERFQPAHEIARLVYRLRLLPLTLTILPRRLRLCDALAKV